MLQYQKMNHAINTESNKTTTNVLGDLEGGGGPIFLSLLSAH